MKSLLHYIKTALITTVVITTNNAIASDNHHAHVHGSAELTLATENNKLFINLTTPADNLLGFEHRAETSIEIANVKQLEKKLSNINNLIIFPESTCLLIDTHLNLDLLLPLKNNQHHHKHSEKKHTEVVVEYTLTCEKRVDIAPATIQLFKHYPAIETIEALWLTDKKQGAITLTPNKNTLSWR